MKILVANKKDWTHPESSGAEVNLRETLSRLSDRGHEVHLLCAAYPDAERETELEGVEIHRYGLVGRTNEIYILTAGQLYLNRLILSLEPDVIYTVHSMMTWIPIFQRDKHFHIVHHLNGKAILHKLDFPYNLLGYIAERFSLWMDRGRKLVSVSPATTANLIDHGISEEQITEIRNGVDTQNIEPGEEADDPTVLYFGRLEYNKGSDLLPEIHRRIQEDYSEEYTLEIAGTGRMEEEVKEFAERHENVRFHGYVSEEKKVQLFQRAWLTIHPSRREGWGLTVLEANAAGTPAVGFGSGGLKHAIKDGETGVLVPDEPYVESRIQEFGKEVYYLLEDEEARKELGRNARSFAESLGWEETASELEERLETVSGGHNT